MSRSWRPASGRTAPRQERTSRSWEVLAHQRQNRGPVGAEAASRVAAVDQRARHGQRRDRVGVVEAGRQRNQRGGSVETDVGLDLASQIGHDAAHVPRRHLLCFLANCDQNLLLTLRAAYVAFYVTVSQPHVLHHVDPIPALTSLTNRTAPIHLHIIPTV